MTNTKSNLREKTLELVRSQSEEDRIKKSLDIKNKLFLLDAFKQARVVLFYASTKEEVNTFDMIKQSHELGKTVALPKANKATLSITPVEYSANDKLSKGAYGIYESDSNARIAVEDLDMVVVPGVVFDKKGNRIGRGAGYYDRFLSELSDNTVTVGLAFDCQMVDTISSIEEHDVSLTHVLCND